MTHLDSSPRLKNHRIRSTHLLTLPAVLALAATASAGAVGGTQQQCFMDSVPMQLTNWSDTVTFPRFDPALGDLQSITFTVAVEVNGSAEAENKDPRPALVTTSFQNFITLQRPDTSIIATSNPQVNFMDVLQGWDGVDDFMGTSGVTHANIVATDTDMVTSPPPASDLTLFTGPQGNPGTITLPITATGSSSASGSGNLLARFTSMAKADVTVCYNYLGNVPPVFTEPQCNATLMASAGVQFTVQVCASDPNPGDVVTLSATQLPAGAVLNPPLPANGNPVCTTITWTPTNGQVGFQTFAFTAVDNHGRSSSCSFNVLVAECHLLIGAGYGSGTATIFGHQYTTQLRSFRLSFPVTMVDMPNIRLPPNRTMWAQVVMYNPEIFPTNDSQWSRVAKVTMHGDGTLTTDWYGTQNGITLDTTTVVDQWGLTRVRFPFTIAGM